MNPNSKDPMTRMFAKREQEQKDALERLEKEKQILENISKTMGEWQP